MTRIFIPVVTSIATLAASATIAENADVVRAHNLTVTETLELMETIEVTSDKPIAVEDQTSGDEIVDAILEEIAQLESDDGSSK